MPKAKKVKHGHVPRCVEHANSNKRCEKCKWHCLCGGVYTAKDTFRKHLRELKSGASGIELTEAVLVSGKTCCTNNCLAYWAPMDILSSLRETEHLTCQQKSV
eukprot:TRINITY_DN451_c0_g1_i12.p3 TRINITY_DN451_c0_g1~~TRINITY_DN451_c0_g1_i12.p3  ORF type:complete len:103 (+),score=12.14 TRINITY_DN451_c0_g1_i12:34-342(+)